MNLLEKLADDSSQKKEPGFRAGYLEGFRTAKAIAIEIAETPNIRTEAILYRIKYLGDGSNDPGSDL